MTVKPKILLVLSLDRLFFWLKNTFLHPGDLLSLTVSSFPNERRMEKLCPPPAVRISSEKHSETVMTFPMCSGQSQSTAGVTPLFIVSTIAASHG